jgi:hypothetical protein
VCFIIGGPDGLDASIGARAQLCWSLSALTFRMRWCASCSLSSCIAPRRCWPGTLTIALES